MLSMFGHVSWETSENMVTWEREFITGKIMDYVELMYGNKEES